MVKFREFQLTKEMVLVQKTQAAKFNHDCQLELLELRHSREITILCSAKVTQHHAKAVALLPPGTAVCRWSNHRRTGRAATPGWLIG